MRYLKSNNEVIFDNLRIDESMFYMSPILRQKLYNMSEKGIEIASDLLLAQGTDVKPDITFIDSSDKEGFITFTQIKKAKKLYDEQYGATHYGQEEVISGNRVTHLSGWVRVEMSADKEESTWDNPSKMASMIPHLYKNDIEDNSRSTGIFTKGRNQVKVGKLINKIFPGKYSDKEIEEFVNLFKASIDTETEKFELVSGDDIAHWYSCDNHYDTKGTLGSSCMRRMSDSTFEIYTENPDVCQMLILKDVETDKLLGRALVWKPTVVTVSKELIEKGKMEYFMDRVYTVKDSDVNKFHDFAEKQGWGRKTRNDYSSHSMVTYKGDDYYVNMNVELSQPDYDNYPYMDTFAEFLDGTLYNNPNANNGGLTLTNTDGTAEGMGVYSEYYDETIPEGEERYSDPLGSYIWSDRSVYVDNGSSHNHGYYPYGHEDLFYDDETDEYYNVEDCVYSDMEDETIPEENAINDIIYDLNFTRDSRGGEGSVYGYTYMRKSDEGDKFMLFDNGFNLELTWFKILNDTQWNGDYNGIHMDLLQMDYNDSPILDGYTEITFGKEEMGDNEFLSIDDWKLLKGLDISEKSDREGYVSRDEDEFSYMKRTWLDNKNYMKLKDMDGEETRKSDIIDFLTYWFNVEIEEEITERKILKFNSFLSK